MHLFPLPKQNEDKLSIEHTKSLLSLLYNEPENSMRVLFSFFGHFGVQVFILLSAYGLTKKYMNSQPIYWVFIWQRIKNIYPSFLLAIVLWLVIVGFYVHGLLGPIKMLYWNFESIFLKLTLISNFLPGKSLAPVGPWWFIPFIFQFYFIFPLILKAYERWHEIALLTLFAFFFVLTLMTNGDLAGVNVYFTIVGHMPTLCLGIYLAKNDTTSINVPLPLILMSLIFYILGNIYEIFFHMSHFSFLILLLVLLGYVEPRMSVALRKMFVFLGKISMMLFLVNGFLRSPMIRWAKAYDNWLYTLILCFIFLIITVAIAVLMQKIERTIVNRLSDGIVKNKKRA